MKKESFEYDEYRGIYSVILNGVFCQKRAGLLKIMILILVIAGLHDNSMSLCDVSWHYLPFEISIQYISIQYDSCILIIILQDRM